ncbi:hypothetical protein BDV38DRAFT_280739 [Aspergillus pseudotamarii]|uniref:Uncharacterized protein n=1 Tax=Aspergillus pseudotamarii TaxID=132259 RepID=A0A5N6T1A0_ASPPS|nr:uncharacterized protein BDV38DRAFT_280739 [Aspergillus pseudotamarii]KAE8139823.1 hypothetical protein BDV38DRAFT_280739 [Aspergillus pseudotamarii]
MNYIFLIWTLLPLKSFAFKDSTFDPEYNFRLRNITGLPYFLYSWIGSYYNGTTTFNLEYLLDGNGDQVCRTFRNKTTIFASESILAVTKTNPDDEGKNPVQIALKSALTDFDFVHASDMGNEERNLRHIIPGYTSESHKPYFNFSLANDLGPPYHITGVSNDTGRGIKTVEMNMSSCDDPADTWWGLTFLDQGNYNPEKIPITEPIASVMFDNQSASFSLNGWFLINNEKGDAMYGEGLIEFLGKIDPLHSDISNKGGNPSWTPTLGFGNNSMNMRFGEESQESVAFRNGAREWLILWPLVGLIFGSLI